MKIGDHQIEPGANLPEADLRGANLRGADLRGADLRGANLRGADLRGADLRRVDLFEASLRGANLRGADLREADLRGANLRGADLRGADLRGADLREANLCRASLRGADLREAAYSITVVLSAQWHKVSEDLCTQLMRLDAEALPDGSAAMTAWAGGDRCPLDATGGTYQRVANFAEKRSAWSPGRPWSLWRIWATLAAEKNIKISGGGKEK